MKNTAIEVLDREHGEKVIKFLESISRNPRGLVGSSTKIDGSNYRFYGIDEKGIIESFSEREIKERGIKIIKLPTKNCSQQIENTSINTKEITMNLVKTKEVTLNETKREITIVVVVENGVVKSGYSVKLPEDKADAKLAEKIATGRAIKEKTNLTPNTELGKGLDKKYILHAIADNLFLKIERGVLKIKGVK